MDNRDPNFKKAVIYKNIYEKIDLKIYGIERQLEYDFIVNPGGDVKDITLQYENVKDTKIDNDGNLVIVTEGAELVHKKPVCYQVINNISIPVKGEFL